MKGTVSVVCREAIPKTAGASDKKIVFVDTCFIVNNMKAGRGIIDSFKSLANNPSIDAIIVTTAVLSEVSSVISRHRVKMEIMESGLDLSAELAQLENFKYNEDMLRDLKAEVWDIDGEDNLCIYEDLMRKGSEKDNSRVGLGEASLLDVAQLYMAEPKYRDHQFVMLSVDSDVHVLLSYLQFNAENSEEVA